MTETSRAILHITQELGLETSSSCLLVNGDKNTVASAFQDITVWQPAIDDHFPDGNYNVIVIDAPQQKDEARYLAARALEKLNKGGTLMMAAANDSGGKSLAKMIAGFGVTVTDYAKHKCRVVVTHQPKLARPEMIAAALVSGGMQQRKDGFWSQPGLFSWDRLDAGTNTLLHHLPFSLAGTGADFGCGIGIIAQRILQRYKDVEKLLCLDIDARAIACCHKNLAEWADKADILQADITGDLSLPPLDFIIMNPPFHRGKNEITALGQAFIAKAAQYLKAEGTLVFVANTHLPYEETVQNNFGFHRILSDKGGFKIIEAIK